MPTYWFTDPATGKRHGLTGDSPPTEQEVMDVFGQMAEEPELPGGWAGLHRGVKSHVLEREAGIESGMQGIRDIASYPFKRILGIDPAGQERTRQAALGKMESVVEGVKGIGNWAKGAITGEGDPAREAKNVVGEVLFPGVQGAYGRGQYAEAAGRAIPSAVELMLGLRAGAEVSKPGGGGPGGGWLRRIKGAGEAGGEWETGLVNPLKPKKSATFGYVKTPPGGGGGGGAPLPGGSPGAIPDVAASADPIAQALRAKVGGLTPRPGAASPLQLARLQAEAAAAEAAAAEAAAVPTQPLPGGVQTTPPRMSPAGGGRPWRPAPGVTPPGQLPPPVMEPVPSHTPLPGGVQGAAAPLRGDPIADAMRGPNWRPPPAPPGKPVTPVEPPPHPRGPGATNVPPTTQATEMEAAANELKKVLSEKPAPTAKTPKPPPAASPSLNAAFDRVEALRAKAKAEGRPFTIQDLVEASKKSGDTAAIKEMIKTTTAATQKPKAVSNIKLVKSGVPEPVGPPAPEVTQRVKNVYERGIKSAIKAKEEGRPVGDIKKQMHDMLERLYKEESGALNMKAFNKDNLKRVSDTLVDYSYFNMLAGKAILKSWAGNAGGGLVLKTLEESLTNPKFPGRMLEQLSQGKRIVSDISKAFKEPVHISQRTGTAPKFPFNLPGKLMQAGDIPTRQILQRAGLSAEDASRAVLLGPARTKIGKWLMELPSKGIAGHVMGPFARTLVNAAESGIERSPFGVMSHTNPLNKALTGVTKLERQKGWARMGLGTGITAGMSQVDTKDIPVWAMPFLSALAGQYALPVGAGLAISKRDPKELWRQLPFVRNPTLEDLKNRMTPPPWRWEKDSSTTDRRPGKPSR